jgi:hypothetical protein
VARLLPTLLVLALLGCTAAAFAVTEGLKLQKSPIGRTVVGKVVAPDSLQHRRVRIRFVLRRADRLTVEIANGSGQVVRVLARDQANPRGTRPFFWDGRDDAGRVVPDGNYVPRVHLARERRTIVLPNTIRMDATPPLVRLVSVQPLVFSPDGDFQHDFVRVTYQTNERASVLLYVDGEPTIQVRRYRRAGKLDWRGKAGRGPQAGPHRLRLRALDLATNLGPPSRAVTVIVRYVELRPHVLHVKTGARFGFRVLTDAKSYAVHLGDLHARRSGQILYLHAPAPGSYVLRVAANGHVARALVVVRP